jgi:alkanesulfonate monooxygenase
VNVPARPLRFHWSVPGTGAGDATGQAQDRRDVNPVADIDAQIELCRLADDGGIDQLLLPIGFARADPITLATYFGMLTKRVGYMVTIRPGVISPTYLVQQVNTVSVVTGGRITVNVVAGHSSEDLRSYGVFGPHDDRSGYGDEFWTICDRLWEQAGPVDFEGRFLRVEGARVNTPFAGDGRTRPVRYFGGGSDLAAELTVRHGDALLRLGDTPENLVPRLAPVLAAGKEVGLLFSLTARPTRAEAVDAALALIEPAADTTDAHWPRPYLFSGAVPVLGPLSLALVGTPDEITDALFEYREIGVTQFLFHGWPDLDSLPYFCQEILPRVRARERGLGIHPGSGTGMGV